MQFIRKTYTANNLHYINVCYIKEVKTLDADLAYVYIYGKKDYIPVYLSYNKELVEEVLKWTD